MTSRATGASLLLVSFNNFGLSPEVVRGTQAMGFTEPTPIQLRAFPIILAGKDLIGTAQTGTGKTAAFALPILTLLGTARKISLSRPRTNARTRRAGRDRLSRLRPLHRSARDRHSRRRRLRQATRGFEAAASMLSSPRRAACSIISSRARMHFRDVTILVLDEVDRMLDMGFLPDVRRIVEKISTDRQTLLFSATLAAGNRAAGRLGPARSRDGRDRRAPFAGRNGHARGLSGRGRTEIRSAHGVARADQFRQRADFFAAPNTAPIESRTS